MVQFDIDRIVLVVSFEYLLDWDLFISRFFERGTSNQPCIFIQNSSDLGRSEDFLLNQVRGIQIILKIKKNVKQDEEWNKKWGQGIQPIEEKAKSYWIPRNR